MWLDVCLDLTIPLSCAGRVMVWLSSSLVVSGTFRFTVEPTREQTELVNDGLEWPERAGNGREDRRAEGSENGRSRDVIALPQTPLPQLPRSQRDAFSVLAAWATTARPTRYVL